MSTIRKLRKTVSRRRRPGQFTTKLAEWMAANNVGPGELEAESGVSRQHLTKLRWTERGKDGVSLRTMKYILWGARKLQGPKVQMSDLFDLEPDDVRDDNPHL